MIKSQNLNLVKSLLKSKSNKQFLTLLLNNHAKSIQIRFKNTDNTPNYENRNILQTRERGLVVGIFPNKM